MKFRACLLAVAVLAMWALKRHYADARVDDLWWILEPTARLVSAATGATFVVAPGEGHFSRERLFLIEKSCAGINFLIAAFGMLIVALLPGVDGRGSALRVLAVGAGASYAAALVVNSTRIVAAMWLAAHKVTPFGLGPAQVHRLEGIIVYFGGLVALHELVTRPLPGGFLRRAAWPLVCYYAITLAIPVLNGAAGRDFFAHAAVVLALPPILILLAKGVRAGVISLSYGQATPHRDRLRDGGTGVDGSRRYAAG